MRSDEGDAPSDFDAGAANQFGLTRRRFAAFALRCGVPAAFFAPERGLASTQLPARPTAWLSPRDFGALMDGVGDDAPALQKTLDAADRSGKVVMIDGRLKIGRTLSLTGLGGFDIDWMASLVSYLGPPGSPLLDMTGAGTIRQRGGAFTGIGTNDFVKTAGSRRAQGAVLPAPLPGEEHWSRQLWFENMVFMGFDTVFDLQNWSREIWVTNCHLTGNLHGISARGKVVNLRVSGTTLYSALASSCAYRCRGDTVDAGRRFGEGHFFQDVIADVQGIAYDVRDLYCWRVAGGQIRSARVGTAIAYSAGVTSLTRDAFVTDALLQGAVDIGAALARQTLMQFKGSNLVFSDVADTAFIVRTNTKGVTLEGASFDTPRGTARMFDIGANCAGIKLEGLQPDAVSYTNAPLIDPTSVAGLEADFTGTWTPRLALDGNSEGIVHRLQAGRFRWSGGTLSGDWQLVVTSTGRASGAMTITGLPYAAQHHDGRATIEKVSGLTLSEPMALDIHEGTSTIAFDNVRVASRTVSETAHTPANANVTGDLVMSGRFSYDLR